MSDDMTDIPDHPDDLLQPSTEETNGKEEPKMEVEEKKEKTPKKSKSSRKDERKRSRTRSPERKKRKRSSSRDRKRSRSRERKRSRSRDKRSRSRAKRSRSRDRRRRSRSRDRDRRRRISRSPLRKSRSPRIPSPPLRRRRSRSRSRGERPRILDHRDRRYSRSPPRRSPIRSGRLPGPERRDVMPFTARKSPPRGAKMDMTAEERDQRTVFILQIARQTRPRDLEEFFSAVGNVRDVRIITDSKTGRSKGICYVEFWEEESVNLALALSGQKLLGAPLIIQRTCAERNRAANVTVGNAIGFGPAVTTGKAKLQISALHPNIDEGMLTGILEPFGKLEKVELFKELSGSSKGYAHVTFKFADDATKALEQLNGFEVAGRPMKVTTVDDDDEKPPADSSTTVNNRSLDSVSEDKQGIALGQGGRIQLMAKLAQGSGMELPVPTAQALAAQNADSNIPAIATQCFMLSNMFDPSKENEPGWAEDVKEDVVEECAKNGGALHVYVDQASAQGNVYVKCPSVAVAFQSVNSLHGRWFSGKVITANYVPVSSYHDLFPDAQHARVPLVPGGRGAPAPPAPIPPPPNAPYSNSFY